MNSKVEIKEVGTKYDFSKCGDPVYEQLEQMAESAKSSLKERSDFLKAIPKSGIPFLDENSGEMITVYPPSKSSTTSIAITLK